jgi:hypothetical protein
MSAPGRSGGRLGDRSAKRAPQPPRGSSRHPTKTPRSHPTISFSADDSSPAYPAVISGNWDCNHSIHGRKLTVTANEARTRSVARVSPLASRAAWTASTLCDRERDRPICERTQGPAPRRWLAPEARPAVLEARPAASEPSRSLAPRRWNARLHRLDCPSRPPVIRPCDSWETHRRSGVNGVWSRLLKRVAGLQRPAGREGLPDAA